MWERYQEETNVPEDRRIALTREEAEALGDPYKNRDYSGDLVAKARAKAAAEGKTWQECLPAVCREEGKLPRPVHLLAAARGDDLKALCQPLAELVKEWGDKKKMLEQAKEYQNKAKELRRRASALGRPQDEDEAADKEGKDEEDDAHAAARAPVLRQVEEICARKWPQAGPVHQAFYTPGETVQTKEGDNSILLLVPRL
jgi:hypothetical protein